MRCGYRTGSSSFSEAHADGQQERRRRRRLHRCRPRRGRRHRDVDARPGVSGEHHHSAGSAMNQSLDLLGRTARILIVDDEPQNRDLIEAMLTPEGFLLQTAASGEEAIAAITHRPPDLILLDMMMPGMDGCQV